MASPSADDVADMRRRRAEGASIAGIMAATGWGRTAVRNALSTPSHRPAAPAGAKTSASGKKAPRSAKTKAKSVAGSRPLAFEAPSGAKSKKPKRGSLVARLWRTAEAQVREVERRLADGKIEPGEREKDARTLAIVVKTLRDLLALEADEHTVEATAPEEEGGDVRDLDDFRRELAERIDRLRRARDADAAAGEL